MLKNITIITIGYIYGSITDLLSCPGLIFQWLHYCEILLHMTVKRAESLVFSTFSSFQSLMVSDCVPEALRFLCSDIRRFEAAWTQTQCLLCCCEGVKQ